MPHLELTYPRADIAVITLNRPDKLNALSYQLVEDLHTTLAEIGDNNEWRVVVLTGAGRGFCSGLDVTDPGPPPAVAGTDFPQSGMRWQERIAELTARLHRLRQRVIAAINGVAYGGGFAIALACDIRIAAESAGSARSSSSSGSAAATSASAVPCRASSARVRRSISDPDGTRGRLRRGAAARSRLAGIPRFLRGRRCSGGGRNPLQLRQIRRGVDQAGDVGKSRRAEPGISLAPGEPQPDSGVHQRRDA